MLLVLIWLIACVAITLYVMWPRHYRMPMSAQIAEYELEKAIHQYREDT